MILFNYLQLIRPYQHIKNILIFPLFFLNYKSINFVSLYFYEMAILFLSFSLAAASVYCFNDCIDYENDKRHEFKKNRPIASGLISVTSASILGFILALSSLFLSYQISSKFTYVIIFYLILNLFYTLILKKIIFLDIIALTFFYLIRLCSPAVLDDVFLSYWFITFTFFLFLSLAILKRYCDFETLRYPIEIKTDIVRNYLLILGVSSSSIAIVIFSNYLNSSEFVRNFTGSFLFYFLIPLILYWFFNIWLHAIQGKISRDPILFAFCNRQSLASITLSIFIVLLTLNVYL